jgi:hypothetical protein
MLSNSRRKVCGHGGTMNHERFAEGPILGFLALAMALAVMLAA